MSKDSIRTIVFWTGILAGGVAAGAPADLRYESYSGVAVAIHSAGFLYGEKDVLEYRGDRLAQRVVLYTCRDGGAFARKTVDYVDPFAPDFSLEDVSTGMTEGVRSDGKARTVFFREARGEVQRSGALPRVTGLVADAGFDAFVHANWQALMTGNGLTLQFLVPSRLRDIGFRVAHLRSIVWEGAPAEVFRLRLSGLWGYILPSIDVTYRTSDRFLVRYVGLSDLRDRSHDNLQVDVTYRDADRKPADAGLFAGELKAPLAPCARRPGDT